MSKCTLTHITVSIYYYCDLVIIATNYIMFCIFQHCLSTLHNLSYSYNPKSRTISPHFTKKEMRHREVKWLPQGQWQSWDLLVPQGYDSIKVTLVCHLLPIHPTIHFADGVKSMKPGFLSKGLA